MRGSYKPALFLSAGFFILGIISVLSNPLNPLFIILGMALIGIAMINLAAAIPVPQKRHAQIPVRQAKPKKKPRKRRK